MKIKELEIFNFRNYDKLMLSFSDQINILYGKNAIGKTNILESIYLVAITKSHRNNDDKTLIKNDKTISKVKGLVISNNKENKMEIVLSNRGKSVKINNNVIKKISDYISVFKVIIFFPDDLELIKGSPLVRRRFMNIEIGQIENKYIRVLNEYNLLLKNRNEYIRNKELNNIDEKYLATVNEQLSKLGSTIIIYRKDFIEKLSEKTNKIYKKIFGVGEIKIEYKTNIDLKSPNLENEYLERINSNLKRDLYLKTTCIGPHRDDILFMLNNNDSRDQASQGQQRTIIISAKLAEAELIKERTNEYPVLLLDDIFSELDLEKNNNLIKSIDRNIQTFITTTDLVRINQKILKNAKLFDIENLEKNKKWFYLINNAWICDIIELYVLIY